MRPEEELICRIFEQAIEDYRVLKVRNILKSKDRASAFSIKELELFFNGKWSTRLLQMINSNLSGKDILSKMLM